MGRTLCEWQRSNGTGLRPKVVVPLQGGWIVVFQHHHDTAQNTDSLVFRTGLQEGDVFL